MKHDSSAKRTSAQPVDGNAQKEHRLRLVPKREDDQSTEKNRKEHQPFDASHWFYASDLFAIPFCLMWVLAYYFTAGSGRDVTNPSASHLFSSATYHVAETLLRWGDTLVRLIWSN